MALRTIADLPALDTDEVLKNESLLETLKESLFEISYMEELGQYDKYRSKHVTFSGLSNLLLNDITNNDYDFYGYKTFHGGSGISGELSLSGDLYVNKDVPDEAWNSYQVVIQAGNTLFNSYNATFNSHNAILSSQNLTAYTNYGQLKTYNGQTTILDWTQNNFTVYPKLYAANISCNNLTAAGNAIFNGIATFKNIIKGCSLCALWADLAELYRADADYPPGTLVKFGGDAEITVADEGVANAVITDKPGLILNGSGGRDGIYKGIALVGRTPVLAVGPVERFDRLGLDPGRPGIAKRAEGHNTVIAVALGKVPAGDIGLVECAVQLTL